MRNILLVIVTSILVSFLFCQPFQYKFIYAAEASEQKNYDEKPFDDLKRLAMQGDAKAQFKLGQRYYVGKDVDRDYREAFRFYKLAADQGDP